MKSFAHKAQDTFWNVYDFYQPRVYGDARFMRPHDLSLHFPKDIGLAVSMDNSLPLGLAFQGVMVEAPTGSGKTSQILMKMLFGWQGSLLVIDAVGKRSIYEASSGYMKKNGYNVIIFRPDDPFNSDRSNPLSVLYTSDQLRQVSEYFAQKIASGKDPIWHEAASNIINVFLTVLKRTGDKKLFNLHNVARMIKKFGVQGKGVRDFIYKTLEPYTPGGDRETWDDFEEFITNLSPATQQGVLFSAGTALKLWRKRTDNTSILTSEDTFDLSKVREEKTIIYIVLPKQKISHYQAFIDLFLFASFEQAAIDGKKDGMLPFSYLLDEFGNFKIHNFSGYCSVLRDFDINLTCFVQSQNQFQDRYGGAGKTILSNLRTKIYLNGVDDDTQIKVSKTLGKRTIQAVVKDKFEDKNGETAKRTITTPMELMTPDQVRMIGENELIMISSNFQPVFLRKLKRYFEIPRLQKFAALSPFEKDFGYKNEVCFILSDQTFEVLRKNAALRDVLDKLEPLKNYEIWGKDELFYFLRKNLEDDEFIRFKAEVVENAETKEDGRKKLPVKQVFLETKKRRA